MLYTNINLTKYVIFTVEIGVVMMVHTIIIRIVSTGLHCPVDTL